MKPKSLYALFVMLLLFTTPCNASQLEPDEELAHIEKTLSQAIDNECIHDKEYLEKVFPVLSITIMKLNLFDYRFGVLPNTLKSWSSIQRKAQFGLEVVKNLKIKDGYIEQDIKDISLGILIGLSGKPNEAIHTLKSFEPGGSCGNWSDLIFNTRTHGQAFFLQLLERYDEAAAVTGELRKWNELINSSHIDQIITHQAFLLDKSSQQEKAIPLYQYVSDLYPNTPGAAYCRKRLESLNRYIEPSVESLVETYYVKGDLRSKKLVITAIGKHRLENSYETLLGLFEEASDEEKGWIIQSLGDLGDQRAIRFLVESFLTGTAKHCNYALWSLYQLGDRTHVREYIERIHSENSLFVVDLKTADQMLRKIFGAGPELGPNDLSFNNGFAESWLLWLEEQQDLKTNT